MVTPITGLVLTGGGARAAYQVGALRALGEIVGGSQPFQVLVGASAGAINSAGLAIHADDYTAGVAHLLATWRLLSPDQVYRTDYKSLVAIGAKWVQQLSSGGLVGKASVNALLDTAPLRELLARTLDMRRIRTHAQAGHLHGVALTATSYHSGTAVTFFDGAAGISPWVRSTRIGSRAELSVEHVLASSAIPMFFPPVSIEGSWYGDGCVRLNAPLSPAIHLGADRILAIGIRYARTAHETIALNRAAARPRPMVSEISGVLLNAIFLDSLDADAELLERVNGTLSLLSREQFARMKHPMRPLPLLVLRPSRDLGSLAVEQYREFPRMLRYLLRGIGATGDQGWDLVSYLAFEPAYIERLLELGYEDTRARRADVEAFFATDPRRPTSFGPHPAE